MYQLTEFDSVIRLSDNASVPADPDNRDWQAYLAWCADGNEAGAAPVVEPEEPAVDPDLASAIEGLIAGRALTVDEAMALTRR